MIRRIAFQNLDQERYQKCLHQAAQQNFFAYPEMLRAVNEERWDFIIYGDYVAVMPVPFVYKFGLKIVVSPWAVQQLGIFSRHDSADINDLLKEFLLKNYLVYYYPFNEKNKFLGDLLQRKNYVLPKDSYERTFQNYSPERRRNLKNKDGIFIKKDRSLAECRAFIFKNIKGGLSEVQKSHFYKILGNIERSGNSKMYTAETSEEILSVAFITIGGSGNYLSVFCNEEASRVTNSASILLDFIIKENIHLADFSMVGSNIPSVGEFYRRFGAERRFYSVIMNSKMKLFGQFWAKIFA